MSENSEYSEVFKRVRDKSYLTQADFAKKLGKSSNYLSMVERGTKNPSRKLVKAVLDFEAELDKSENPGTSTEKHPTTTGIALPSAEATIAALLQELAEARKTISTLNDDLRQSHQTIANLVELLAPMKPHSAPKPQTETVHRRGIQHEAEAGDIGLVAERPPVAQVKRSL